MIDFDDVPFPTGARPSKWRVADWVELRALSSKLLFKRGDLKSAIGSEDVDSPDLLEEQVWNELKLRSEMFGATWPFRFRDVSLQQRRALGPRALYRHLCLLGMGEIVENSDRSYFEELVAYLLRPLAGGPTVRVGHPASPGQPSSFVTRMDEMWKHADVSEEERGKPLVRTDNDLGLDVVGWFPFRDSRGCEVHIWAQCATGHNWSQKLTDLDFNVWESHTDFGVKPIRVFATPLALTLSGVRWKRASKRGGLVLDRARLMELASVAEVPSTVMSKVRSRYRVLIPAA